MRALAERARAASRLLGRAPTEQKDRALEAIARALESRRDRILGANRQDIATAGELSPHLRDRLRVDIDAIAAAVREVVRLPDPVGEVTERWTRPNGLAIRRERLPLGVVLVIYESRPNVTVDAAALCLKSGNAVILRGGSEAARTNAALAEALAEGLHAAGLPGDGAQVVPTTDRAAVLELLKLEDLIDLAIPRGGEGLIRFVSENARVPVLKHAKGVCHTYVHTAASVEKALAICYNGKVQRPGVCNATEALLVDRAIANEFLPAAAERLSSAGVQLRCDPESLRMLQGRPGVRAAVPGDFGQEFLDLILAVRVVGGLDEALDHIARYGSNHTESIVTEDEATAKRFEREVVASCVLWNASTRFNDGGELGLGAEIGISTSKLHAFGPMGLRELCAQKFVVEGSGQVRR